MTMDDVKNYLAGPDGPWVVLLALTVLRPALAALFAYVPTSQVLLGSDFPFGTSADGIRGLEEYGLKPGDLQAIYRGNAERLLPRLKV